MTKFRLISVPIYAYLLLSSSVMSSSIRFSGGLVSYIGAAVGAGYGSYADRGVGVGYSAAIGGAVGALIESDPRVLFPAVILGGIGGGLGAKYGEEIMSPEYGPVIGGSLGALLGYVANYKEAPNQGVIVGALGGTVGGFLLSALGEMFPILRIFSAIISGGYGAYLGNLVGHASLLARCEENEDCKYKKI